MNSHDFANKVVEQVRLIGNVDVATSELQPNPAQEEIMDMDVTIDGRVFNLIVHTFYLRNQEDPIEVNRTL